MSCENTPPGWALLLYSVRAHHGCAKRYLANWVAGAYLETLSPTTVQTTFGTDFACIARSVLEHGFDKAANITDGYASMSDELKEQFKKQRLATMTILFDDAQTCKDFTEFGEVVRLEEVCR